MLRLTHLLVLALALPACKDGPDECLGRQDSTYFRDLDEDGFGDPNDSTVYCLLPEGYVENFEDCDDLRPQSFPGALELCDGFDNDCDGDVDEELIQRDFYEDLDGDSWGNASRKTSACLVPPGYAERARDCNDDDAQVNPDALELCNGFDDNCDGKTDDADPGLDVSTADRWHADRDDDGYGSTTDYVDRCTQPADYVTDGSDCNDDDDAVKPNAVEVCDNIDNDCDGLKDDVDPDLDTSTLRLVYGDADGDGYGDPTVTLETCYAPWFYVDNADDCDDENPEVNLLTDVRWQLDADGDGFPDLDAAELTGTCQAPNGYVLAGLKGDCDDTDDEVNPEAVEICNEVDDDCDGLIDDEDDTLDQSTGDIYFNDNDGDGYGNAKNPLSSCVQPEGTLTIGLDCDDTDPDVNPDGAEICNGKDDDCNGKTDSADALVDLSTQADWFRDGDGDGYGSISQTVFQCDEPSGYVLNADDCDDNNNKLGPPTAWARDIDGDGWGAGAQVGVTSCLPPQDTNYVPLDVIPDCDDTSAAVYPGAREVCGDGIDNDCLDGDISDPQDPRCDDPTLYPTCATASESNGISVGAFEFTDTNASGGSRLNVSAAACTGFPSSGREKLIKVTIPPQATLQAQMSCNYDASLYLLRDCEDASTCIVGSDALGGGASESIQYTNTSTSTFFGYVVADSYSGQGPFKLNITISQ